MVSDIKKEERNMKEFHFSKRRNKYANTLRVECEFACQKGLQQKISNLSASLVGKSLNQKLITKNSVQLCVNREMLTTRRSEGASFK